MRMKKTCGAVIYLIAVLAGRPDSAVSSPVTWEFEGEITIVDDRANVFGGAVTPGSTFSGEFTFDSDTPDSRLLEPRLGVYDDAITAISGEVAGITFLGPEIGDSFIQIDNGFFGATRDEFKTETRVHIEGQTLDLILALTDLSGTMFVDDSLSMRPPDFNQLSRTEFVIVDASEQLQVGLFGELTFIVPEPNTVFLICVGALYATRRKSVSRMAH